jgi:excisionase family DNA binding protein
MDNMQMLFPIEPKEFWRQLKRVIEEVMEQKNVSHSSPQPTNDRSPKPLLKAAEVCELFQVSKPTIYDWMNKGKLKSIKIRSRRYFLWLDIEELIRDSQSGNVMRSMDS